MLTGNLLSEYVTTIIPRTLVEKAQAVLVAANDRDLDAYTVALSRSLVRDHHRDAVKVIKSILGDLGPGDALAAVAEKLAEVGTGASVESLWDLARWDEWARGLTGRASLEGVARATLRNEIATMIVGAPAMKRERDTLLDAVRAASGDDQMTVLEAVKRLREAERETPNQ